MNLRLSVAAALALLTVTAAAKADEIHIYRGTFDGGEGELVVSSPEGGDIGKLDVGGHNCGGGVAGSVNQTKTTLVLERPAGFGADDECRITFKKVGTSLVGSDESSGCNAYHGASCDFDMSNLHQVR